MTSEELLSPDCWLEDALMSQLPQFPLQEPAAASLVGALQMQSQQRAGMATLRSVHVSQPGLGEP